MEGPAGAAVGPLAASAGGLPRLVPPVVPAGVVYVEVGVGYRTRWVWVWVWVTGHGCTWRWVEGRERVACDQTDFRSTLARRWLRWVWKLCF